MALSQLGDCGWATQTAQTSPRSPRPTLYCFRSQRCVSASQTQSVNRRLRSGKSGSPLTWKPKRSQSSSPGHLPVHTSRRGSSAWKCAQPSAAQPQCGQRSMSQPLLRRWPIAAPQSGQGPGFMINAYCFCTALATAPHSPPPLARPRRARVRLGNSRITRWCGSVDVSCALTANCNVRSNGKVEGTAPLAGSVSFSPSNTSRMNCFPLTRRPPPTLSRAPVQQIAGQPPDRGHLAAPIRQTKCEPSGDRV